MHGEMHADLTRRVVLSITKDQRIARIASEFARFPDEVDDVQILTGWPRRALTWAMGPAGRRIRCLAEKTTPTVFGRRLCSLTHFANGYDWRVDPSVPKLDLPNRTLRCLPGRWGLRGEPLHPMIPTLAGRDMPADEFAYPSAVQMVAWISTHLELRPGSMKRRARLLGAMLHFVEDMAVWHHAADHGRLLAGHLEYEGEWQRFWFSEESPADEAVSDAAHVHRTILGPADHCRRVAEATVGLGTGTPWADLTRHAVNASADLTHWWWGWCNTWWLGGHGRKP